MTVLPLEIRNAGAALSILGESCDYFQQFRELTENVADLAKADPSSQFICDWTYDKGIFENGLTWGALEIPSGTYKLGCYDNGPGMDEKTLTGPIRSLFNSGTGHDQGNFGIGAKVAGLSRHAHNDLGLLFITKQAGKPAEAALLNKNGLVQMQVEVDGSLEDWPVVPCDQVGIQVPDVIRRNGHGTAVILLGDALGIDTIRPPQSVLDELPGKKRVWLPQYLIRRYYDFPENLKVRAFEAGISGAEDKELHAVSNGNGGETVIMNRSVKPFTDMVRKHSKLSGTIQLSDATAMWFVIDNSSQTTGKDHMISPVDRSGSAVLWRGELYEREPAVALAKFGIYTGERNVFILLQPKDEVVSSNATRDALYVSGKPVRGEYVRRWAQELRDKIKDTELGSWMASQGVKQSGDSRNRILDALKHAGAQLKIKGFRLGESQEQTAVSPAAGGTPAIDPNGTGAGSIASNGKSSGDGSQQNRPVLRDPKGEQIGSPMLADCAPDIYWKGAENFEQGDKDAGTYTPGGHDNPLGTLTLNKDFKFYRQLQASLLTAVSGYTKSKDFTPEQLESITENLVQHVVGTEFSEVILRAYVNAKNFGGKWHQDSLDDVFTPQVIALISLRSTTTVPVMVERFRASAQSWINVE